MCHQRHGVRVGQWCVERRIVQTLGDQADQEVNWYGISKQLGHSYMGSWCYTSSARLAHVQLPSERL